MPHGAVCHTYHQEFFEYEPSKRRGFDHSSSKTSLRLSHSHHEYHTFWEEMEHFCALSIYRYKCTCDEYEDEQRRLHPASKKSSSSTKRVSSKEYHDKQVMEPKNSGIESRPREPRDDIRSWTEGLVESMMGEIRQVLNSYFEQNNHVSTDGNKRDVHSNPPLIEEVSMNTSNEHELEKLEVSPTLVSCCELVEKELCENELEKENGKLSEMSEQWIEKNRMEQDKNNSALVRSKKGN